MDMEMERAHLMSLFVLEDQHFEPTCDPLSLCPCNRSQSFFSVWLRVSFSNAAWLWLLLFCYWSFCLWYWWRSEWPSILIDDIGIWGPWDKRFFLQFLFIFQIEKKFFFLLSGWKKPRYVCVTFNRPPIKSITRLGSKIRIKQFRHQTELLVNKAPQKRNCRLNALSRSKYYQNDWSANISTGGHVAWKGDQTT